MRSWAKSLLIALLALLFVSLTIQAQDASKQDKSKDTSGKKTVRVALIQFDAVPEKPKDNVDSMERLTEAAVKRGARWVMFHEMAVCDCTDKLDQFAELVPDGPSTQRMLKVAERLKCYVSFGLSE